MKKYFSYFLIFILSCFLSSCAIQSGGLTGGKKDTKPPLVKSELPANKTINFESRRIVITFDEFIVLDNVYKEIIISPTLTKLPDIFISRKSIVVNFNSIELKPNTTYSIQFGSCIKDLNEGNPLKNYRYVFSTGSYLDSFTIQGKVLEGLSHKPAGGYKVELYTKGNDSGIFKKKPLYYTRVDSAGKFKLDYLPLGSYLLYAINDKNDNYNIDDGEEIGYPGHVIKVDTGVVIKDSIFTFPFVPTRLVLKKAQLSNHSLQLKYDHNVDSLFILVNGHRFYTNYERINLERDSFIYWMSENFPEMRVNAYYKGYKNDTIIKMLEKVKPVKFSYDITCSFENVNYFYQPVIIKATKPIVTILSKKILFYEDTMLVNNYKVVYLDSSKSRFSLLYSFSENKTYKLKILPGAIISIFNESNKDTIQSVLNLPGTKNYGNLEVSTITPMGNYIFQLVSESGVVSFYKNVSRETNIKIPFVNPGKYTLRLINDLNNNGFWDGGNIITGLQPEPVFYFQKVINVKANWELAGIKFDITKK